jgi:DUF4097 and DUF4098 domain-containing protein YvlB
MEGFMKGICLIGLITTAFALAMGSQAPAQDNPDRVAVSFSDPSRPGLVKVHMVEGSITIQAYNGKDVTVETKRRGRPTNRRQDSNAQGLRRIDNNSSNLVVEEENNVITISTGIGRNGNLDIQVPARTNLNVSTVNGGDVVIEGVDGEIEASNTNGRVTLTDVSGSVVAHSVNGRVIAGLKRVTPQKSMAFTSLNGNVDVTMPADVKANVKMRTDNGEIYTDFDIQLKPSGANTTTDDSRARGGRYRIEVDKSMTGTINGGGPDMEFRTFNGNLYIRKAK